MFVSDVFFTVIVRLNSTVTLASNQGGTILWSEKQINFYDKINKLH